MSDSWNAIVLDVVELTDTMPVYGCSIVFKVVGDVDHEIVTPVGDDGWTWDGAIECEYKSFVSVRSKS